VDWSLRLFQARRASSISYWWAKEPAYRWNIILWDTVALVMVLIILALITRHKKEFLITAFICGIIGALSTVYLKKAYPPD